MRCAISFNFPVQTKANVSWGPARLFIGPSGATPTVDLGAIAADGYQVELTSEKREITQGNPKMVCQVFNQAVGVRLVVTSIEWNFTSISYALGSGNTTVSGSAETFAFGGEPGVTEVALRSQHEMQAGNTMTVNMWTAVSDGDVTIPFSHDEHEFEYSWKAIISDTNWAGVATAKNEKLVLFNREL